MVKVQRINVNGMLIYKWDVCISVTPKLRDHHRREDDMTVRVRGWGGPAETASSEHDRTSSHMNSSHLWLPEQDQASQHPSIDGRCS